MALTLRRKTSKIKPSPDAMTLGEHLAELRNRLLIAISSFVAAAIVIFIVYSHVLHFLAGSVLQDRSQGSMRALRDEPAWTGCRYASTWRPTAVSCLLAR